MEAQHRDLSIDILRAIALIGLVLAHVHSPVWLFQLRNFDVPMMVFLSGVAYVLTANRKVSYVVYVFKRFVRIIIPTWIFLVFFQIGIIHQPLQGTLGKLSLMTSWYVWIMRVFFVIALVAPFVVPYLLKQKLWVCFAFLCFLLGVNEYICSLSWAEGSPSSKNVIFLMNVPYIIIFSFGCIIHRMNKRSILLMMLFAVLIYLILGVYFLFTTGQYMQTQVQKYPPRLYYTSYAWIWICVLWLLKNRIKEFFAKCHLLNVLTFVGSHTMWIYFWHIIFLEIMPSRIIWSLLFFVVFVSSSIVVYIQHLILFYLTSRLPISVNKYIRVIFDG